MSKYESKRLEVIVMAKGFCWKIWFKKFGVNAIVVILAGLAAVYGDNTYYLALAPVLKGLQNFLKHKYEMNI